MACSPGCSSLVDGLRCGFRTGRDCPAPYSAAEVQLSAAMWDPLNQSHAEALAKSEERSTAACSNSRANHKILRSGSWCIKQQAGSPPKFTIKSADGQQHSYQLSEVRHTEHGEAWGGVTRVLHALLRPHEGRRSYRSLLDLGAGLGQYGRALLAIDPRHRYSGYDGAGNAANISSGFVRFADMTLALSLPRAHWVLSIDAGEHVPRPHEMSFVRNLHAHACIGVIISWADLSQVGARAHKSGPHTKRARTRECVDACVRQTHVRVSPCTCINELARFAPHRVAPATSTATRPHTSSSASRISATFSTAASRAGCATSRRPTAQTATCPSSSRCAAARPSSRAEGRARAPRVAGSGGRNHIARLQIHVVSPQARQPRAGGSAGRRGRNSPT